MHYVVLIDLKIYCILKQKICDILIISTSLNDVRHSTALDHKGIINTII